MWGHRDQFWGWRDSLSFTSGPSNHTCCEPGRRERQLWIVWFLGFVPARLASVLHDKWNWGRLCLCSRSLLPWGLSIPQSQAPPHLWGLQHINLQVFLGCSRLLGKPDTGENKKPNGKSLFASPWTYVSLLFCYCLYLFKQEELFFPFHSIIPLFIPKLWIEGWPDARHVLNTAEPGVSKTWHCTYPPNLTV